MRLDKKLGIGLLTAGLAFGWAGSVRGEDKPPVDQPGKDSGDRPRPRGEEGGGRERRDPQKMFDRMEEMLGKLNLSDEQKTKTKGIIDKARADLKAIGKPAEGQERGEFGEKVRGVLDPMREQLMAALDDTQKEKLREEFKNAGGRPGGEGGPRGERGDGQRGRGGPDGGRERGEGGRPPHERGPGGPGGPGGPPRPEGMIQHLRDNLGKLELNEEQKKKTEALLAETEKKLSALQTEAEKARAEMQGKFRDAMQSNHAQLDSILTEEQKTKLKEMMPPPRPPEGKGEGHRPDGDKPRKDEPKK